MNLFLLCAVMLDLTFAGYLLGRRQAVATAGGDARRLHSLPSYHGFYVALWALLPALCLLALWLIVEPRIAEQMLLARLPASVLAQDPDSLRLLIGDIKSLAVGNIVSREIDPELKAAAESYAA